jgi:hypothetical protein
VTGVNRIQIPKNKTVGDCGVMAAAQEGSGEGDGTFHFYGQPDAAFACESSDLRKSLDKWDMSGVRLLFK